MNHASEMAIFGSANIVIASWVDARDREWLLNVGRIDEQPSLLAYQVDIDMWFWWSASGLPSSLWHALEMCVEIAKELSEQEWSFPPNLGDSVQVRVGPGDDWMQTEVVAVDWLCGLMYTKRPNSQRFDPHFRPGSTEHQLRLDDVGKSWRTWQNQFPRDPRKAMRDVALCALSRGHAPFA
jgi:hypothetical protein